MGNPAEPEIIYHGLFISEEATLGIKTGYQGDVVFDRKFNKSDKGMVLNQGVVTLNYIDRFELYGSGGHASFRSKNRFTVGGGGKVLLSEWGNVGIGLDGKYQYSPLFREYQVAFGAYYTFDYFIPYVGIKYSNIHAKKLFSNVLYGTAVGFTFSSGKWGDLNFEVQLIDELAISFGGNIKF